MDEYEIFYIPNITAIIFTEQKVLRFEFQIVIFSLYLIVYIVFIV